MSRYLKSSEKNAGKAPDDLVFIGKQKIENAFVRVMDFDSENLEEVEAGTPEDCFRFINTETVTWISV